MSQPGSAPASLLDHAKRLYGCAAAEDILGYGCREARRRLGPEVVLASYLPTRDGWGRGIHLAFAGEPGSLQPMSPAAVSAGFALHRRLSRRPEPFWVGRAEESAALFRAVGFDAAADAVAWTVPLFNGRKRIVGQIAKVWAGRAELSSPLQTEWRELVELLEVALDGAQRLAFARRDQGRLMLLAEATQEALWDWNLESNAFWWGSGIQNVLRSGREILGLTASWKLERIHPEDRPRVQASLEKALSSTEATWTAQFRFQRSNLSWATVEDRGHILRDASGRAYRMLGVLRDVSEKQWIALQQELLVRSSAALSESIEVERNLQSVADGAAHTIADACAILLVDPDRPETRTLALSLGAEPEVRLRGALEEAARSLPSGFEPLAKSIVVAQLGEPELAAASTAGPALAEAVRLSGLYSLICVPILSGGRPVGWIGLGTTRASMRSYEPSDLAWAEELARRCAVAVEKARLYRQAQDAIRARDSFMAMLGHELRNPLSPIATALHLMKLREPRSSRELEMIDRQVKHLGRLVDDLLDVSRIERGKLDLTRKPLQLGEVVARSVEIAGPLIEGRAHHLEIDVAPTGLMVLADEMRLTQVISNLLTNAARYTDVGGRIGISARCEGQQVELRVRDNGVGIAAELLPRIFDLFVQGPRGADRRQGGLGLGLSIVRSLVALHGGTVEARSEGLGKGSEFLVRLPLLQVAPVPDEARSVVERGRGNGPPLQILVVDDNLDAAETLTEWLALDGHEVVTAHDGPQALEVVERFLPEVAILDIGLPVMDGYELAKRISASLTPRPYLIALSGYGQAEDRTRARNAGFDDHMVKPPNLDRLARMIEKAAEKRRRGSQAR